VTGPAYAKAMAGRQVAGKNRFKGVFQTRSEVEAVERVEGGNAAEMLSWLCELLVRPQLAQLSQHLISMRTSVRKQTTEYTEYTERRKVEERGELERKSGKR